MTPKPTRVTNDLARLRTARGLTQADVARAVGVTRQTVNAIEGGKYSPSLEVAFLVARLLDVPLEEAFGLADQPD